VIREHATAVADFLGTLGVTAYDTEAGRKFDDTVEAAVLPYAIISVASPVSSTDGIVSGRERKELDTTVGYHGSTPRQAQWLADRVAQLAGVHLAVAGWQCVVESAFTTPVRPDRDNPDQTVWSGADGFTVLSYPA
jgi:hypothetical protein